MKDHHCYLCDQRKPAEAFAKDKSRRSGVTSACRECMKIKNRERREQIKEMVAKLRGDNVRLREVIIRLRRRNSATRGLGLHM